MKEREIHLKECLNNSVFILNQIDRIEKEYNTIMDEFNLYIHNTFNVLINNLNSIGISAKKLDLLLYQTKSLKNYIEYILFDIKEKDDRDNNFFNYLITNLNKDFNLNLSEDCYVKIKKKYTLTEQEEEMLEYVNKLIQDNTFFGELNGEQYKYFNKKLKKNTPKNDSKEDQLKESIIKSMRNILEDFCDFDFSGLKMSLIKELKLSEKELELNNKNEMIRKQLVNLMSNPYSIQFPIKFIDSCEQYINKLLNLEKESYQIKQLQTKFHSVKYFVNKNMAIRFCCYGCYSSGKSSLLNNIIGYGLNLCEVSDRECTKIALVIKYVNKKSQIALYKTQLKEHKYSEYNYFETDDNSRITLGAEDVKNTLKKLNQNNDNFYYLLTTPIELLDNLKIDEQIKTQIEFIDYPGLNTELLNKEENKNSKDNLLSKIQAKIKLMFVEDVPDNEPQKYNEKEERIKESKNKILKISNGFIFINGGTEIEKGDILKILRNIYEILSNKAIPFNLGNCIFVLTKCESEKNLNLVEVAEKIKKVFYMKQSENGIAQSVGEGEKIQGMRNLNICNFSNILYSSYKENERKINDFDKFMDDLIKEGKTNKKDVCEFIESKLTNYFNLNTVRFNIDQYIEEKELYTKKLRIILQKQKVDDDVSDEQINGIILKYLKLKFNLTLIPKFKKSNADVLFYYFEKIIDSSKKEFEKRIRQEAIHLAKILFEEFLELKHKIENTEI